MSLVFNQKITLDLTISRVQNVHCSQDDADSRNILITLSDNGKPYSIPSEVRIFLKISKPDNTYVYIDEDDADHLFRNDDGTISIILSEQATCVPGICEAELQFITPKETISTRKFNIIVKKSVINDEEIESVIESNIIQKMIRHLIDFMNPHKVNKEQVGLGNVPNVTTNDQTPTYEEAEEFENISSGEKLSIAFGKIQKAISSLLGHINNFDNPHKTTKSQIQLGNVDNTSDVDKPVSTAQQKAIDGAYANSNKYTDQKIADLINGAPETMDTLKEIADAIEKNKSVVEALDKSIGTKANQNELDTHTGNDTIHITSDERTKWNDANNKKHSHNNKSVLDGITSELVQKWSNGSSLTGIKGDAEKNYRTGNVNLTPENIGAATSADLTAHKKIEAITSIGNTHPLGHVMVYDEKEEVTGTNQCAVPSLNLFQREINLLSSSLAKGNYLPLSGGTMTGTIIGQHKLPGSTASDSNGMVLGVQTTSNTGIFNGNGDGNGADVANLIIKSWYGVGFVDGCSGQGMTVGIDCRSGNITCNSITIRNVGSVTDLLNSKLSTSASCNKNWNWSGKNETPAWIWGGSDGTNMYVYNPTYILVQGIRNRVTNRAMTITDDNHVRTYESNGVGMNGAISLGSANYRFSQLYVTSSSISTSDKNYKDDIKSLTDKHLQFFMKLQPVSFLFKDGTSGRTHIGFIAQDVEQAMSECGLTDLDFAGFCKDQKIDSKLVDGEEVNEPILDENGNPEYIYSLRYEEFIALNTYVIQELWKRVDAVEKENIETKNQIKSMQQDIAELKK
ncbi:tail fiber domain-containing protein [Roseburia intestinalis]|uniref:tail fiber domain-containing protein n=1 Tax=Roseburia intestinalis TaxID=166486 RepID=UPI0022E7E5F5|nr:tail fiber domain-containing protein [Roseburia intestinalis]